MTRRTAASAMRPRAVTLLLLAAAAAATAQPAPPVTYGGAVPVYTERGDAQAVAAGQFGAVPVEITAGQDLVVVVLPCGAEVAQVRSRAGRLAWVPIVSLPRGIAMPACGAKAPQAGERQTTQPLSAPEATSALTTRTP